MFIFYLKTQQGHHYLTIVPPQTLDGSWYNMSWIFFKGDKRERWECSSMNSSFCPLEGTVINKVKSLYLHSTFKNGVIPKCFPVKNKKRGIKIVKGGKTKTNKMNKSGKE